MEGMRRNKGVTGLALLAILALTMSATVGTAATASGGSAAEIAKKKKCKKKKASSSKKKKCKKKKKKGAKPAPLVRATIDLGRDLPTRTSTCSCSTPAATARGPAATTIAEHDHPARRHRR